MPVGTVSSRHSGPRSGMSRVQRAVRHGTVVVVVITSGRVRVVVVAPGIVEVVVVEVVVRRGNVVVTAGSVLVVVVEEDVVVIVRVVVVVRVGESGPTNAPKAEGVPPNHGRIAVTAPPGDVPSSSQMARQPGATATTRLPAGSTATPPPEQVRMVPETRFRSEERRVGKERRKR